MWCSTKVANQNKPTQGWNKMKIKNTYTFEFSSVYTSLIIRDNLNALARRRIPLKLRTTWLVLPKLKLKIAPRIVKSNSCLFNNRIIVTKAKINLRKLKDLKDITTNASMSSMKLQWEQIRFLFVNTKGETRFAAKLGTYSIIWESILEKSRTSA